MQIWAIARQMVAECVRMKVAIVFVVLLAMVLLGLPLSVTGDSSLTGVVQSFMSYALSATSVLLGMLTIFMSRSLSDEFVNRQVFGVMTKPIPRWRFILGKWLGMMMLNVVFLAFSGLALYGMVYYLKQTHPPMDDKYDAKELVDEVLVARHSIRSTLPDFSKPAAAEFERNEEQGFYVDLPAFDPEFEKARLEVKYQARWRVVPVYDSRVFFFEGVLCDRSADKSVQLRYKTEVTRYAPDEVFRAYWRFGDPSKGTAAYDFRSRHVVGRFHTIRIPADAVAADHTLLVTFRNANPFKGEVQANNLIEFRATEAPELLFVVGTFEWNLFRVLLLIFCKLMFLGAVAILMATLFSFPVACLGAFTVYVLAAARTFLVEAFDYISDDRASMFSSVNEFVIQSIAQGYDMIHWVLPNFGRYDAVETFVNGRNVSLVWVLQGISELAILNTGIILGIAILLFYRREVAEVSV